MFWRHFVASVEKKYAAVEKIGFMVFPHDDRAAMKMLRRNAVQGKFPTSDQQKAAWKKSGSTEG